MSTKPILFLDFDGVLNSWAFLKRARKAEGRNVSLWNNLDPIAVRRLNYLVKMSRCDVVVSSTWRTMKEHDTAEKLQDILVSFGYRHEVKGITPRLGCQAHRDLGWEKCCDGHRGSEIKAYLDGLPEKVTNIAILDDDSDMNPLLHRHVKTNMDFGLLMTHVWKAHALMSIY